MKNHLESLKVVVASTLTEKTKLEKIWGSIFRTLSVTVLYDHMFGNTEVNVVHGINDMVSNNANYGRKVVCFSKNTDSSSIQS